MFQHLVDYIPWLVKKKKGGAGEWVLLSDDNEAPQTVRYCYTSALMLACFHLTKGRAMYFWPETTVASFLHLISQSVIQSLLSELNIWNVESIYPKWTFKNYVKYFPVLEYNTLCSSWLSLCTLAPSSLFARGCVKAISTLIYFIYSLRLLK